MRKPSEMTRPEFDHANSLLPDEWSYDPNENQIECDCDHQYYRYLPMADLKKFLDYLTSINVDWNGE